jgi:hypothetical protein
MCYQLPGLITIDGRPILGGTDINATDLAFAQRLYPPVGASMPSPDRATAGESYAQSYQDDAEFVLEPALVD